MGSGALELGSLVFVNLQWVLEMTYIKQRGHLGWEDGSVFISTICSSGGFEISFPHPPHQVTVPVILNSRVSLTMGEKRCFQGSRSWALWGAGCQDGGLAGLGVTGSWSSWVPASRSHADSTISY